MEWKDIQGLFAKAQRSSTHEWVEYGDSSEEEQEDSDLDEVDEAQVKKEEAALGAGLEDSVLSEREAQAVRMAKKQRANKAPAQPSLAALTPTAKDGTLPTAGTTEGATGGGGGGGGSKLEQPQAGESMYSRGEDDRNTQWIRQRYLSHQKAGARRSDATLACPSCFTVLCYDCQQHERYHSQFRAMFVCNCKISDSQVLRAEGEDAVFKPVHCAYCSTEVGVIDADEVYHFFNVFPSDAL